MADVDSNEKIAWGVASRGESRWPASIAVLLAMLLYITLPERLTLGPGWLIPALELTVLLPLTISFPRREAHESKAAQYLASMLIAIVNIANLCSLALLVYTLLYHGKSVTGPELIYSSVGIWITNVIVFSLWYWELDRGGPDDRAHDKHPAPDFLFPQMSTPGCSKPDWTPHYLDYLYVAFTNATAFSPTDVLPLSIMAKMLMLAQSITSLITITLVAARAVNILE